MVRRLIKNKHKKKKQEQVKVPEKTQSEEQEPLSNSINDNEKKFQSIYEGSADVVFRSFFIGGKTKAILVYIDGMSNTEEIDNSVLTPLMKDTNTDDNKIDQFIKDNIPVSSIKEIQTISESTEEISSGNPIILVDNSKTGFSLGLAKWGQRSIESPEAERVVRGPREGFIETLSVNTSMIRRKIRSPKLKMKSLQVGRYTETEVIITYIEGIVDNTLIEEVTNRVKRIDIDGILESGMIEEFIEDYPYSPFPQVLDTERPDVVTAALLEGRAAILIDGTPFAIIVPTTLYSLLQSNEDYYTRSIIATLTRWLRYIFILVALLLPSLYVAVLTFHAEMVPTSLLISIISTRDQVPFPALIEVLIMEVVFEALREAGVRLPSQLGSAVSIVGALVIGEAAVQAGIVSPPMVIVVAVTGVASFTIPRYSAQIAIRMLRFPMIFLAGTLGLLGITLGIIAIIVHLTTIRSFGVPYLSPMAPMHGSEMKDVLVRAPWWKLNKRPHFTGKYNKYRQGSGQKPSPIRGKE